MISTTPGVNIQGVAVYVPQNHGSFDQEVGQYSQNLESSAKLKTVMGYGKHHYLKNSISFTDFSKVALEKFFETNKILPESIDAIVVVCQSPDNFLPNNSTKIHGMFDFRSDCYCVDLPDGCAGYIRGLLECGMLLNSSSAKNILLICGDILSVKVSKNDRNSFPLIGDAVAISLISRHEGSGAKAEFFFNGKGWDAIVVPAGGYAMPSNESTRALQEDEEGNRRSLENLVMKGRDVFTFTQTTVVEFADTFLKKNFSDKTPDYIFSHQPNKFILDRIKKRLRVPDEKMVTDVVSHYGNSSSATIPLAMAMQAKSGGLGAPFSCMLLGFGVGLTWAAMRLDNTKLDFCFIEEVDV